MKSVFLFQIFYVVLISVFVSSCLRKGEKDPLISFRTRDARIIGKWKLIMMENRTISIGYYCNYNYKRVGTLNGSTLSYSLDGKYQAWNGFQYVCRDTSYIFASLYSRNMEIKKSGYYCYKLVNGNDAYSWEDRWYWENADKKTNIII